jgi:DNA-binding NarL/FixJ family response regulator
MQRPLVLVVSDHPLVFDRIRAAFEPDFDVLTMAPHAESVVAAVGILDPEAVIADLSGRSVRTAPLTARLLEELPDARLVVLMDREPNPDARRREWLESGLERDALGPELASGLRRAFGGRVRALHITADEPEAPFGDMPEVGYSPTFNC